MTVRYAIANGEMDPECMRCGGCIDVRGVLLLDEDDVMCRRCVPPAAAQVAEALQSVYDVIVLDSPAADQAHAIAQSLRCLAEMSDRIQSGEATVRKRVTLVAFPWQPDLAGIQVDYQVDNICEKEN
ncbi:hypothetical protein AB0H37_14650 [Actinomadura sp. NPDC023710]|uniref:hypothetical protein n=1 Tax=Actinomadura sp. NPDC023710 TaxID=3158219 RepID=UPI0033CD45EC